MQQVQPVGLRVGATQGWDFTKVQYCEGAQSLNWRYQLLVRRTIADYGCFVMNTYFYNTKNESFNAVVVYYRYLQRSRLPGYLAAMVRRGDAVLAPPWLRFFLARKVRHIRPKSTYFSNRLLVDASTEFSRGYGDTELSHLGPDQLIHRRTLTYRLRGRLMQEIFQDHYTHVILYDVGQFIRIVNPWLIGSYYVFRRFSKLLYLHDAIQITTFVSRTHTPHLLAHILAVGIERHETRRQQKRFLRMFKSILDRVISWPLISRKPFDWRISLYGRLDAEIRRKHTMFQVGKTSYNTLDNLNNYTLHTAKTKFSTTSVRIWMRNLVHWEQVKGGNR